MLFGERHGICFPPLCIFVGSTRDLGVHCCCHPLSGRKEGSVGTLRYRGKEFSGYGSAHVVSGVRSCFRDLKSQKQVPEIPGNAGNKIRASNPPNSVGSSMVVTPILSLPFKVKASFSFCFSSSLYLCLPNMSAITEVGQMGGRLGGEGQQGPEGEKEATSEVCLASASPLAPESPFAMAPLHLYGQCGTHPLPCLPKIPPK